ncbi:hypothetical protein SAMN05421868_1281, partial [Paenibacillus naphthalenovorans]
AQCDRRKVRRRQTQVGSGPNLHPQCSHELNSYRHPVSGNEPGTATTGSFFLFFQIYPIPTAFSLENPPENHGLGMFGTGRYKLMLFSKPYVDRPLYHFRYHHSNLSLDSNAHVYNRLRKLYTNRALIRWGDHYTADYVGPEHLWQSVRLVPKRKGGSAI